MYEKYDFLVGILRTLKEDYKKLKGIFLSKDEVFLKVDFDFYKKWKLLIKLIIFFNKNYVPCEIARKKFKQDKNFIVIGLRWNGRKVKRRTLGFARKFVIRNKDAKCIYCETDLTISNATTDHIIPIALRGNNTQVNLICSCRQCNLDRGVIPFNEFIKTKNIKYKDIKYIFI